MIFDTHIHTKFSTDSKMQIQDAIEKAKQMNVGLTITDHIDLLHPEGTFVFDIDQYFAEYQKYHDDGILMGIEIGMREDCIVEDEQIAKNHPFDFILCSIHLVDGIDIYYDTFYQNRTKKETYTRYFQTMLNNIKRHTYMDALGHIDYIARYGRYEDKEVYYHEFKSYIDEILQTVLINDIVLELNTRRLVDRAVVKVLTPIYKRYAELGGKYITLGSDAHKVEDIAIAFDVAQEFAAQCSLKPVYFNQRNMEYITK